MRITKWLGDGAMLSGMHASAVAACAAEARDRVATEGAFAVAGRDRERAVIMFEGDEYVGAAVNLAARLCRAAEPHRVLAAANALNPTTPLKLVTRSRGRVMLDNSRTRCRLSR